MFSPVATAASNRQVAKRACLNCKKSHLGCDLERPCRRCVKAGKECIDLPIKKRGRPKIPMLLPQDGHSMGGMVTSTSMSSLMDDDEDMHICSPVSLSSAATFRRESERVFCSPASCLPLLEPICIMSIYLSPHGIISKVPPEISDFIGYPPSHLLAQPIWSLLHDTDQQWLNGAILTLRSLTRKSSSLSSEPSPICYGILRLLTFPEKEAKFFDVALRRTTMYEIESDVGREVEYLVLSLSQGFHS